MILADITLKGFRNYKDAHIKLEKNTLIIGANDVGKTNLIWAMRLLLDRSLSDYDIEPRSSDFYVLEVTHLSYYYTLQILLRNVFCLN